VTRAAAASRSSLAASAEAAASASRLRTSRDIGERRDENEMGGGEGKRLPGFRLLRVPFLRYGGALHVTVD
jgi:hypothetical protein